MAIYLEDFERNYLISLITGIKYTGNKPVEVPEKTIPKTYKIPKFENPQKALFA